MLDNSHTRERLAEMFDKRAAGVPARVLADGAHLVERLGWDLGRGAELPDGTHEERVRRMQCF